MNLLVSGGAGYIGSIATRRLLDLGYKVSVIDNLSHGFRKAVAKEADFFEIDISNLEQVSLICKKNKIEAVLHFAAFIEVGESVKFPEKYLENNFKKAEKFLEAVVGSGVKKFILSSTAAVYGSPTEVPIPESHAKNPINPYGESKSRFEDVLEGFRKTQKISYACLRYFNVAGAMPDASLGEAHEPETHLIPNILLAAMGKRPELQIFGDDYPTRDGTCVRDYVHVVDLIDAHLLALKALASTDKLICNVGSEEGFTVKEVIAAAERMSGKKIPFKQMPRREGDPAVLIASSNKIRNELGWKPNYPGLDAMIEHAWHWHQSHPNGYK